METPQLTYLILRLIRWHLQTRFVQKHHLSFQLVDRESLMHNLLVLMLGGLLLRHDYSFALWGALDTGVLTALGCLPCQQMQLICRLYLSRILLQLRWVEVTWCLVGSSCCSAASMRELFHCTVFLIYNCLIKRSGVAHKHTNKWIQSCLRTRQPC